MVYQEAPEKAGNDRACESYRDRFRQRINSIWAGGWEHLEDIETFPPEAGRGILGEILETGCLAQNAANILCAREAAARLPGDWLRENLPGAAAAYLFREPGWEEWEFRRLAEMLKKPFPELLSRWADYARRLGDPEVNEAITDFTESTI